MHQVPLQLQQQHLHAAACRGARASEGAHLWADDSLDVLQGRVGGRRGAVGSGARCAVAMIARFRLPQRSMGRVTLETERQGERCVSCSHSHSLVEEQTASVLCPSKCLPFNVCVRHKRHQGRRVAQKTAADSAGPAVLTSDSTDFSLLVDSAIVLVSALFRTFWQKPADFNRNVFPKDLE